MGTLAARSLALAALAALLGACGSSAPLPQRGGSGGIAMRPPGGSGGGGGEAGAGGAGGVGGGGGDETPTLEIRAVHPAYGSANGNTRVTISGAGFVQSVPDEGYGASTVVLFGDNPTVDLRVVDDQTILATAPPGRVGDADLVIRNESGEAVCTACFHYLPPLELVSLEPDAASLDGGSRVRLRGEGLSEETTVLFGGRAASAPHLAEDGSLEVVVPPGDAPGRVDVRVYAASRESLLRRGFRYLPQFRAEGIEPPASPLAGGGRALLEGEGFSPSTRVFFGGVEAELRLEEAGLEVVVPAADLPGPVEVEVVEGGSRATLPFAYFDPAERGLALHAIAPDHGPATGGQEVAILGSGFDQPGLALSFGEALAPSFEAEGPNVLRAVTPPGAAGPIEVRLRTTEGASAGAYHYFLPFELHAVEPAAGPTAGGTLLTLRGAGFPQNPRVFVGGQEATGVVRLDEGHVQAISPPGGDGEAPVLVIDADAPTNRARLDAAFEYRGPLRLEVADPPTGARAGGARVVLRGAGFRGEMKVSFGATEAASVRVVDPHTLEVTAPRGDVGLVDLQVEREDGARATLDGGFYYFNPGSAYGGASGGPLRGVLNVTALARSGPDRNAPIEGCLVQVGADETALRSERTDDRGQVTFSAPSLVKAVNVTVSCEDYELATLVNQVSENVTVLLRFNGTYPIDDDEEEEDEGEIEVEPPGTSTITGRVFGFKPPAARVLRPNEELVAQVTLAHRSAYAAPPFGGQMPTITLREEGEPFAFRFWGPAHATVYALYGIRNVDTEAFEPLVLGFVRGVSAAEHRTVQVDLVLDTRLDQTVPVSLPEPSWYLPGAVTVRAFLDLGADGLIPLGEARNSPQVDLAQLRAMPRMWGEDLLFQAWSSEEGARPWSLTFARHGGDPREGVTMGPLLAPLRLQAPPGGFEGLLEWELAPGASAPDVIHLQFYDGATGKALWHAVLAGDERRLRLPDDALAELRARAAGSELRVELVAGRQATFSFDGWDYQRLTTGNFSAFTWDSASIPLPP